MAVEPEARKVVTVLFTDVAGSTALGERLDPELLRNVMWRYFEAGQAAPKVPSTSWTVVWIGASGNALCSARTTRSAPPRCVR